MNNSALFTLLSMCSLLIFPASAHAIIVTGESIEWVLATSDRVVVGKVVKVDRLTGPDNKPYEMATVAISKSLKGRQTDRETFLLEVHTLGHPPKEHRYGQQWLDEGNPIMFCLVRNDGKRVPFEADKIPWVFRDGVLLGKTKHKWTMGCIPVLTRDFDVLTERDSILQYAEQTVTAAPKHWVPRSHTLNVPTKTAVFERLWSRSSVRLVVPVDEKLEVLGQKWCASTDSWERVEGAQILGHFKNEKNIAILKSLLADPTIGESTLYRATDKTRAELVYRKNLYVVRKAAFDALREYGVDIDRPVLEELLEGRDNPDALLDLFGDPLPTGALARMGTARLRGQVLTFSEDGKTLVTVGADRALHYWQVATGTELQRKALSFAIDQGRFDVVHLTRGRSEDGKRYVSADRKTIRVWETATGKELHTLPNPTFPVLGLAVSNDGQWVAADFLDVRAQECLVFLWDTATGKKQQFSFAAKDYSYPAFSPNGKILVVAGQQGMIRFYETATGKELRQIKTEAITINPSYPAISPNNETLAWLDGARKIKLWNMGDGTEKASFEVPEIGRNYHFRFSQDGKRLALSTEQAILIFDTDARNEPRKIPLQVPKSFLAAQRAELAFSPDGKTCAVSRIGGARLYDIATGKLLAQPQGHEGGPRSIVFSPDGKTLASGALEDPTIRLWETATGKPLLALNIADHADALLFLRDGKHLVTGDRMGTIQFWDVKSGEPARKFELNEDRAAKIQYPVTRLAADGRTLSALGSRSQGGLHGRHVIWDLATGKVRNQVNFSLSFGWLFAPDGTTLHVEQRTIVRDALTGKPVLKLSDPSVGPYSFAWDSKRLAVASAETATLFELPSGRELVKIATGKVGDLEISPDGKILAVASRDELSLFEVATGQRAYRLPAPGPHSAADGVSFSIRFAFSPDGKSVAVGLRDTTVLILDIAPGLARTPGLAQSVDPQDLDRLWSDLAGDDAAQAYRAIWTLAGAPDQVIRLLKSRLKPADNNGQRLEKLLADLDSDKSPLRNAAFQELKNHDIEVEPALRRALAAGPSLEFSRRAEMLLALPPAIVRGREALRGFRAIQMLEANGTPAARQLLQVLATGAVEARLTQEAKASLERLELPRGR